MVSLAVPQVCFCPSLILAIAPMQMHRLLFEVIHIKTFFFGPGGLSFGLTAWAGPQCNRDEWQVERRQESAGCSAQRYSSPATSTSSHCGAHRPPCTTFSLSLLTPKENSNNPCTTTQEWSTYSTQNSGQSHLLNYSASWQWRMIRVAVLYTSPP